MSVRKAAALAIAQLGVAAFFVSGVTRSALGESAGWFVLAATMLAAFVRAIDIESWALLIPGGFASRVRAAFGPRAVGFAAAAALVERLLLGALACVVLGHYVAGVAVTAIAGWRWTGYVRTEDLATVVAAGAIGLLWIRARIGRDIGRDPMTRGVWIGIAILMLTMLWGVVTVVRSSTALTSLASPPPPLTITGWSLIDPALVYIVGFALTLTVVGGGEALARAAHEFPPPRLHALRRTGLLTLFFALCVTTVGTFLVVLLVPASEQGLWVNAPLAALAQHLAGPAWVRDVAALALAGAAVCLLLPAAHAALGDAEHMIHRLSADGTLPRGLASLHPRFGTPARAVDVTVAAMILAILASGGQVMWLARAYALAIAVMLVLTIAALVRLRRTRRGAMPFRTPVNLRLGGRELPLGLLGPGLIVAVSALAMIVIGDVASIAAGALITAVALWFTVVRRHVDPAGISTDEDTFDLLLAAELSLDQIEARPGNVLVPVRNPHLLAHVVGSACRRQAIGTSWS